MSHALNIAAANVNAPRIDESTPHALPSLAGMGRAQLREAALACGVEERKAKMRANQLFGWIYHYGSTSFDEMTNIDK